MAKQRKQSKRRGAKGALTIIATLFLVSGGLRIGLEATEAIAREAIAPDATETALSEPSVPEQCLGDDELIALIEAMDVREDRIRVGEEKIAMRMRALKTADQKIEAKLSELRDAEAKLRATIAVADTAAESDLTRLTTVYENMKPKDAAALFETMAPEFAAGFIGRMRPEAAAGVMTGLSPEVAYSVSVILAGRNANAPKK